MSYPNNLKRISLISRLSTMNDENVEKIDHVLSLAQTKDNIQQISIQIEKNQLSNGDWTSFKAKCSKISWIYYGWDCTQQTMTFGTVWNLIFQRKRR